MIQKQFLETIKSRIPNNSSLNEEVARVLDISYDASHRRTSLKSKFSLQESIQLANHFNISLDSLFAITSEELVVVKRTQSINNENALQNYFETSYQSLSKFAKQKEAHIYYSAKDIPIFYTLDNNRLSHFKFYVWLKLLNPSFRTKQFKEYYPKLDTIKSASKLKQLYQNLKISEIWDLTTINSTLKQIHFYYKARQIDFETALELCDLLEKVLNEISDKVLQKKNFKLYYNELLLMNNNVFVKADNKRLLYVPFSMLTYFVTSNEKLVKKQKAFNKQLKQSKLLNTSGEKEQNDFYVKVMQKIDALKSLLQSEQILDFQ